MMEHCFVPCGGVETALLEKLQTGIENSPSGETRFMDFDLANSKNVFVNVKNCSAQKMT